MMRSIICSPGFCRLQTRAMSANVANELGQRTASALEKYTNVHKHTKSSGEEKTPEKDPTGPRCDCRAWTNQSWGNESLWSHHRSPQWWENICWTRLTSIPERGEKSASTSFITKRDTKQVFEKPSDISSSLKLGQSTTEEEAARVSSTRGNISTTLDSSNTFLCRAAC